MSAVPREVLEVRAYADGGLEVALPDQEERRLSLFPGADLPRPPRHPALGRVLGAATWDGQPVWLEERAGGPLLSELQGLPATRIARALQDLAAGLAALHGSGLAHGSVTAGRVVVRSDGRAQLIGAGAASGRVSDDLNALRDLMLSLWPADAPDAPDPGPGEPASVLSESLAGWLAYHHPETTAAPWAPPGPTVPEMALVIALEPAPEASHLDEIGFDLGPEPDGEQSRSGTAAGHTDHTRPASALYGASERRQALLGRLLAFGDLPGDPARFQGGEGQPSAAIKALIADEPLDPLPLPDGVPPLGQALEPPVIHEVERTATGESTNTRVTAALTELVSRQALAFTVAASVVAITALGALVWLLLQR